MSQNNIPQMKPYFGIEEKSALAAYMDEDGYITEYKRTEAFESLIADYTKSKHCIVVNNGTVSLTLAALALGVLPGDEVIVPNYTMIATPNSVKMIGAVPIFVDIEPDSLCLNLDLIENHLTEKTKAIILVSANGRYPYKNIEDFKKFSHKHNLHLIEDAAQALGSFYPDGGHIGTKGRVGSFSFSTPKIISTGQGGALITNDESLAKRIRKLKDFGRTNGGIDIHETIGYNFKFTELQACIGIEQMRKLPARVKRKKEIWSRYYNNLADVSEVNLFHHNLEHTSPWFIDCLVERRAELISYLHNASIGTRVMYPPINRQIAYNLRGDYPVSSRIGECGLWLPSYIQLSDSDIDRVCDKVKNFYHNI